MPLTTLIFVRHAQSLHPHADDRTRPLTEAGLRDRSLVLETLKERQIDAFLCSPYKRSVDTIQTTADYFGMEIKTDERFRERESGSNASQTLEKRWADFSFAEEGGENLGSVQTRNMEALKEALKTYAGKTIVIGTHGMALSTILHYYDNSFGVQDFRRIVNWMPYIVELTFEGDTLLEKKELAHKVICFYHGSVISGLDTVLANAKSHVDENKVAYFTTDRVYALVCCRTREENFVTMGPKDGVQHYFERFPDQLKTMYDGREGFLYRPVSVQSLTKGKGNSWVSREAVPVTLIEHIPNVYPEILKEEAAGNVIIHRYGEIDPEEQKTHANYMRDHLEDMAEYKDFLIKHFSSLWD